MRRKRNSCSASIDSEHFTAAAAKLQEEADGRSFMVGASVPWLKAARTDEWWWE
jgi:hypothetical protein